MVDGKAGFQKAWHRTTIFDDADVAQVEALRIADEAWTTDYVAADRVYRTDRATGVKNWQTAQAAIDRDLTIAVAPLDETLTLAYLAAQTAYWIPNKGPEQRGPEQRGQASFFRLPGLSAALATAET
jgi:hypothetical protein